LCYSSEYGVILPYSLEYPVVEVEEECERNDASGEEETPVHVVSEQ